MIRFYFFFGLILGLSHFEGGLITLFFQDRGRHNLLRIFQPFSSGALLSMALIHLIPFSMRRLSWSPVIFLVTISGLMVLWEFGRPDRFILTPGWGQRSLIFLYALSLGILVGLGSIRVALIATIVGVPAQFVQGIKGFMNRVPQLSKGEFFERLFLNSLSIPITILVLYRFSNLLRPVHVGFLFSFSTAVILFQGILEFRIPYPFKFSPLKVLYFLAGIFVVYCL
ncbi:MAG: hypothetical protein ACMUIM_00030 [bacterium]